MTRLLTAFAGEFKEVAEMSVGNIAVAVGLKQVQYFTPNRLKYVFNL